MSIRGLSISASFALAATLSLATPALAGSVQEKGETTGLDLATPLPTGLYFVNLGNFGSYSSSPRLDTLIDIPVLLYSTPFTILGGTPAVGFTTPLVLAGIHGSGGTDIDGWYYPAVLYSLGWKLTPNFSAAVLGATYFPVNNSLTHIIIGDRGTTRFGLAGTYTAGSLLFSAEFQYGVPFGSDATVPSGDHEWINYDLTFIDTVGKWQLGAVGYGSADTSNPPNVPNYQKQDQFAMGPLVGYNFGPVILQTKFTVDLTETGYGGRDVRFWTNLIIPLL